MRNTLTYAGEIALQLDSMRKKGQKEAANSRPPTDAIQLDQYESALQSETEKWMNTEQRLFDTVLGEASKAIVDSQQKTIELQNTFDQLLADGSLHTTVEADLSAEREAIISATENRMRTEQDWKFLRDNNGITAQASYPESLFFHLGLIAVLALVETIINAFFYENAQGLLGGFVVALSVAVVNMLFALGLGYGYRYKNLAPIETKILGWSFLIAFILLTIFCNALFSTFRTEYQLLLDPTDMVQVHQGFALAMTEAKKVFVLDMKVADLNSFVLFGLGLVLGGVAFYKGYTVDDKYPGYGKIDRRLRFARAVEFGLQEMTRHKVKAFLLLRRSELQAAQAEPTRLVGLVARRISDLHAAQGKLTAQAKAIQCDFAMVLTAYRNANMAIRAANPPAYFSLMPDAAERIDASAVAALIAQLDAVQSEIRVLRESHQDQMNEKLRSMQEDATSILKEMLSAFSREIEEEARERINRSVATIGRTSASISNA